MAPRKLIAIALWAVVLAGVGYLGYQGLIGADEGSTEASDAPTASAPEASSGADVQVVVYYFHTDRRCESCLMLEREGRQAVERNFAEALDRDALTFRAVNVQRSANRHYVDEFDIYGSSLFGVLYQGDDTERVLDLTAPLYQGEIRTVEAYRRHVVDGVERLLQAGNLLGAGTSSQPGGER